MGADICETWDKWFQWKILQPEKLSHEQDLDWNSQYAPIYFMALKNIPMCYLGFGSAGKGQKTQNTSDLNKTEKKKWFSWTSRYRGSGTVLVVHDHQEPRLLLSCGSNTFSTWLPPQGLRWLLQLQATCSRSNQRWVERSRAWPVLPRAVSGRCSIAHPPTSHLHDHS